MEITEKSFWEKYWGDIKLPKKVDFGFKNDRVIAETILKYVPKADENDIASEIGCAPGKWILLLHEKLNYNIDGFEYLNLAAEKTRENLTLCNVPKEKFNIITSDFLEEIPIPKYKLVTSFGFLEHFDNYEEIFQKHLAYTTEGGYTVIGFPNFRGLSYYIQSFIDRVSGTEIIKNHNISMMDKELMIEMVQKSNREIVYIDYVGGLEFGLFNMNAISNIFLRIIVKIIIKSLSIIFLKTKNKYLSSYLIFVVK